MAELLTEEVPDLMNRMPPPELPVTRVVVTDIQIGFWRTVSLSLHLATAVAVAGLFIYFFNLLLGGALLQLAK